MFPLADYNQLQCIYRNDKKLCGKMGNTPAAAKDDVRGIKRKNNQECRAHLLIDQYHQEFINIPGL